jgi:hypothetical protein
MMGGRYNHPADPRGGESVQHADPNVILRPDLRERMMSQAIERTGLKTSIPDEDAPAWVREHHDVRTPAPIVGIKLGPSAFEPRTESWLMSCPNHGDIEAAVLDMEIVPRFRERPRVAMQRMTFVDPIPDTARFRLFAVFVGQCPACSTIYWSVAEIPGEWGESPMRAYPLI